MSRYTSFSSYLFGHDPCSPLFFVFAELYNLSLRSFFVGLIIIIIIIIRALRIFFCSCLLLLLLHETNIIIDHLLASYVYSLLLLHISISLIGHHPPYLLLPAHVPSPQPPRPSVFDVYDSAYT